MRKTSPTENKTGNPREELERYLNAPREDEFGDVVLW
jgi:hypothetical protein